jgi:ribosomal protein S18 acetylase RimI-like enzyme
MGTYLVRKATAGDIPFLVDTVVAAEKNGTDKLSYSTLFNLSEQKAKDYIKAMFEEDIDGCEFSLTSFLVAEYEGQPVAAFGGWIETLNEDNMASNMLKSNLIRFTFGKEPMGFLKTKVALVSELVSEREPLTLQLEYLYVTVAHRGKGLSNILIDGLIKAAAVTYPALTKVQVQVYSNNNNAVSVYKKNGFEVGRSYKAKNEEVLNLLPWNEKYIMEKKLKK